MNHVAKSIFRNCSLYGGSKTRCRNNSTLKSVSLWTIPPCTRRYNIEAKRHKVTNTSKKTNTQIYVSDSKSKTYVKDIDIEQEYGLTKSDLEGVPYKKLRNAYEDIESMYKTGHFESRLYPRDQVVKRAMEKYKTQLNMTVQRRKFKKHEEEEEGITDAMTSLLKILTKQKKDIKNRKANSTWHANEEHKRRQILSSLSVVGVSIGTNVIVGLGKFGSYFYTGSASMLSEAIHSVIDTMNQLFLAFGLIYSLKKPHSDHPYGFDKARYVYALISGVSIFEMGAVFTIKHGVNQLYHPDLVLDHSLTMAYTVLTFCALVEGYSLFYAISAAKIQSKFEGVTLYQYVFKGHEPNTIAVLAEDIAAVTGIIIAGAGIGLSTYTGNPMYDAIGSIGIGTLLGSMALFIIIRNKDALVGRSMNIQKQQIIVDMLERDNSVLSVNDVKTMVEGPSYVRFKAEIFFDTDEVTRLYLDNIDKLSLMNDLKNVKSEYEFEEFMKKQSASLIDTLALEVDRLEYMIKRKYPEIRHVDLELL